MSRPLGQQAGPKSLMQHVASASLIAAAISLTALLGGCAEIVSNTASSVSASDIKPGKYKKIAIFVENTEDADRINFEVAAASSLQRAGLEGKSSFELFNYSKLRFNPDQQAQMVRDNNFDSALYVTVAQKALLQEPVAVESTMVLGDQRLICRRNAIGQICSSPASTSFFGPDGRLFRQVVTLLLKAELQDIVSGKQVWTAETSISFEGNNFGAIATLFDRAMRELSARMRIDGVI